MSIPRNFSSKEMLVCLINQTNLTTKNYVPLDPAFVQFRNVVSIVDSDKHDTEVEYTTSLDPDVNDWKTLYYRRVPLSLLLDSNVYGCEIEDKDEYVTTHDLIPALNNLFKVQLSSEDIDSSVICKEAADDDGMLLVTIRASKHALIVRGLIGIRLTNIKKPVSDLN